MGQAMRQKQEQQEGKSVYVTRSPILLVKLLQSGIIITISEICSRCQQDDFAFAFVFVFFCGK